MSQVDLFLRIMTAALLLGVETEVQAMWPAVNQVNAELVLKRCILTSCLFQMP